MVPISSKGVLEFHASFFNPLGLYSPVIAKIDFSLRAKITSPRTINSYDFH